MHNRKRASREVMTCIQKILLNAVIQNFFETDILSKAKNRKCVENMHRHSEGALATSSVPEAIFYGSYLTSKSRQESPVLANLSISHVNNKKEAGWGFYPNNNAKAQIFFRNSQSEAYKKRHSDLALRHSEGALATEESQLLSSYTIQDLFKKAAFSLAEAMSGFSKYAKSCCARVVIKSSNCLKQLRNEIKTTRALNNPRPAFSLAEAMITLLMVSIILAAIAPIMSKRMRLTQTGFSSLTKQKTYMAFFDDPTKNGTNENTFEVPHGVSSFFLTAIGGGGAGGDAIIGSQIITGDASNWTVPEEVTKIRVYMIGGGGSGAAGGAGVGTEYSAPILANQYLVWDSEVEYTLGIPPYSRATGTASALLESAPPLPSKCQVGSGAKWEFNASESSPMQVNVTGCGGGGGGSLAQTTDAKAFGGGSGGIASVNVALTHAPEIAIGGRGLYAGSAGSANVVSNPVGGAGSGGGGTGGTGAQDCSSRSTVYGGGGGGGGDVWGGGGGGGQNNTPVCALQAAMGGGLASGGKGGEGGGQSNGGRGGDGGLGGQAAGGRTVPLSCGSNYYVAGGGGGGGSAARFGVRGKSETQIFSGGGGGAAVGSCSSSMGQGGGGGGGGPSGGNGGNGLFNGSSFGPTQSGGKGGGPNGVDATTAEGGSPANRYGIPSGFCDGGRGVAHQLINKTALGVYKEAGDGGLPYIKVTWLQSTPALKCSYSLPATGAGGGGGAQVWVGEIDVPSDRKLNFVVGLGGATQISYGTNGNAGTQTYISNTSGTKLAYSDGGGGGRYTKDSAQINNTYGVGGGKNTVNWKDWTGLNIQGGTNGANGTLNSGDAGGSGGSGGNTYFKDATIMKGGTGGGASTNGNAPTGAVYGSGGGGGGGVSKGSTPGTGARGANGYIYIEWGGANAGGGSSAQVVDRRVLTNLKYKEQIAVTVGKGGINSTDKALGKGEDSKFGTYITALGGDRGEDGGMGVGLHGKGGLSVGVGSLPGTDGLDDFGGIGGDAKYTLADVEQGIGGCGGNVITATCAGFTDASPQGKPGSKPGAGGGGGAIKDNTPYKGADGADGIVIVEWE